MLEGFNTLADMRDRVSFSVTSSSARTQPFSNSYTTLRLQRLVINPPPPFMTRVQLAPNVIDRPNEAILYAQPASAIGPATARGMWELF